MNDDQDDEYGYTHDDSGEWRVWRPAQCSA